MAPPPELNEDIIAEILLCIPPDEPVHLVRVSLVSKPWRRIVSDHTFLRRYHRFHRTPPLLGFFDDFLSSSFVPITAAFPFPKATFNSRPAWYVLDSHHGHVLLQHRITYNFLVWDPIIGEPQEVRDPTMLYESSIVLCAIAGCDHCDCHGGPFLVVCVSTNYRDDSVRGCVYASQVGKWDFVSVHLDVNIDHCWDLVNSNSGALVGDGVYFVLALVAGDRILKYDLGMHCLSTIDLPDLDSNKNIVLMATEDGLLGLAAISASTLLLWSRMVAGWVQYRVIDLQTVLPITISMDKVKIIGFAESVNIMFVGTNVGTFIIYLNSGLARKVSGAIYNHIPSYHSSYHPSI